MRKQGRSLKTQTLARSRKRLSREALARLALELADREGLEAVSMRRLAQELGVGVMTLYGYLRDKDELLDAIVDMAVEEVRLPGATGPWRVRIKHLLWEIRRVLARHPAGIRIRLTRPMISPGALRTTESAMVILGQAGFSRSEAARGYRTLFLYTFGFASFSDPKNAKEVQDISVRVVRQLPPDAYPAVTAAATELAQTMGGDAQFEYGLELILDSLELRRMQAAGSSPHQNDGG